MATAAGKPVMAPKPGSSAPGNNASIRLEKGNQGIRRSTPDSEALTSSDDELDHRQGPTSTAAPLSKPVRRTSWLNEVPQNLPRRTSITTSGSLAPVGINTQSPENDQTGWGANTSPGMNGSISWGHGSSFPWATGIWTADGNRKEPPPRLTELSQSPTMPNMPGASLNTEEILSPTARSMTGGDSSIPFNIPLHPTPKTYRSQSYSVGQLDPETVKLMASKVPSNYNAASRGRTGNQYPGLQHRPSRPSMLEDLGHDPALLGRVREDEDDEEEEDNLDSNGSHSYAASQARAIDQLARENALLRQTAHLEGVRMRDRTMSSASANSNYSLSGGLHNLHRIRGGVPEEVDLAVADQDELGEIPPGYGNVRNSGRRRMSEHSVNLEKHLTPFGSVENRPLESLRRAHWQTSLGFGSIGELPQSRRHSFAEIPTRHGSISESQAHMGALNGRASLVDREDGYSNVIDGGLHTAAPDNLSSSLHQSYNVPSAYGRPQPGLTPSHQSQRLYIVTFKCHRADVFYIQEDTGLQVNPGNLVIVEADRGTDLGTIQHANITWQEARELKEKYAEEHYKCLMMFSRQAQNGASNVVSPSMGHRSAVGGMNPTGAHGAHEPQSTEIKPKLIKRLAQNHEILTLRDKEGNEAKAKRVCQQKVVDHRLNMEILDAEFQMDWKKLTFYYFADSYINFNSLVTDLFKIYKTRIWMSAINPASFVTPSPGLPATEPAGLSYNQNSVADRRHAHDNRAYNVSQIPPGSGNLRDAVERAELGNTHAGMIRNAYMDQYHQAFSSVGAGAGARHHEPGFGHNMASNDPFASYPSSTYALLEASTPDFVGGGAPHHGHQQMHHPTRGDWVETFQGLSLGS